MIKWYLGLFLLLIAFGAGIFLTHSFYSSKNNRITTESVVVMAEKITDVLKLVAVEGRFSEIYSYEDYRGWNWFPLRKKVLVKVDATVSVGFDLEDFCVYADESRRKVVINQPAPPSILSVDHQLSYYDISQGAFNVFSASDYNRIHTRAKEFILVTASANTDLFERANAQWSEVIASFGQLLFTMGWELEVIPWEPVYQDLTGPQWFALSDPEIEMAR